MRLSLQFLKSPVFIYTIKCLLGLGIGYWLYISFPHHEFYWTMISVLLVMAPDPKDSSKLAFDRMKANLIGSLIGLILFVINGPNLLLLSIGVIATIGLCSLLKLLPVGRMALAAMLIVMIHEKSGSTWEVALERVGCVVMGCIIAIGISFIFGYLTKDKSAVSK